MMQEFNSVWHAIEDGPVLAENLRLRSELMMVISEYVKQSGKTQVDAAKLLGTTQPRLNDVMKGRIEKCSVDRLVNMLAAIGFKVSLSVEQAA